MKIVNLSYCDENKLNSFNTYYLEQPRYVSGYEITEDKFGTFCIYRGEGKKGLKKIQSGLIDLSAAVEVANKLVTNELRC